MGFGQPGRTSVPVGLPDQIVERCSSVYQRRDSPGRDRIVEPLAAGRANVGYDVWDRRAIRKLDDGRFTTDSLRTTDRAGFQWRQSHFHRFLLNRRGTN